MEFPELDKDIPTTPGVQTEISVYVYSTKEGFLMNTIDQQRSIYNQPETHVLAIVSLVLSILGLLPILPLVGSIVGIITGYIARSEIRKQPDQFHGDGTAKAGIVLGWIGVALALLAACGLLFFLVVFNRAYGT